MMNQREINRLQNLPKVIDSVEDIESMIVYIMRSQTKHTARGYMTSFGSLAEDIQIRGLRKQAKFYCEYYNVSYDDVWSYYFNKHYSEIYAA